jgi:hypothetical protein
MNGPERLARTGPPPRRTAPPPRRRPKDPRRTPFLALGAAWIQGVVGGLLRFLRARK